MHPLVIAAFVIGFCGYVELAKGGRPRPGEVCLKMFLAIAGVSVLFSAHEDNLQEFGKLIVIIPAFFIGSRVLNTERRFVQLRWGIIVSSAIVMGIAYMQLLNVLPVDLASSKYISLHGERIARVSGTYDSPLALYSYLIVGFVFGLEALRVARGWRFGVLVAYSAAILVATYYTYLRSPLVGMLIGGAVTLWLSRSVKATWLVSAVVVVGVLLAGNSLMVLYSDAIELQKGTETAVVGDDFLDGRIGIWKAYLSDLNSGGIGGWLFGRGGSHMEDFVPISTNDGRQRELDEPHNDLVRILHAYGAVGLSFYCIALWQIGRGAWALTKCVRVDRFQRSLGTVTLGLLTSTVWLSFTTEPTRYVSLAVYVLALGSAAVTFGSGRPVTRPVWMTRDDTRGGLVDVQ